MQRTRLLDDCCGNLCGKQSLREYVDNSVRHHETRTKLNHTLRYLFSFDKLVFVSSAEVPGHETIVVDIKAPEGRGIIYAKVL